MFKKISLIICLVVACSLYAKNPKYVFLFIGDGMSSPQRNMAEAYLKATTGEQLFINHMPVKAATKTGSANALITDSAASGTAIACGEKTNNGRIGMLPDGKTKQESVAYVAQKAGKKIGIITSVTTNHATPSAFYGNRPSRGQYYELGLDLIKSNFDFIGGGGLSKRNDKKSPEYQGDLYDLARKAGYKVVKTPEDIEKLTAKDGKIIARGASGALPYAIDKKPGLKLHDFVRKGIEVLDNPNGFFIMTEGGAIDWMCHGNDAATVIFEVLEFDKAVKVAYDFALKHPEDTLIVVTGDHETGGLTLGFANTGISKDLKKLSLQTASSGAFNSMVRNALKGNNAPTLDDVKPVISKLFGLKFDGDPNDDMFVKPAEMTQLQNAFDKQFNADKTVAAKNKDALKFASLKVFNAKVGISWSTYGHSALPVITSAWGNGSKLFDKDIFENTYIAKTLKKLVLKD